MHKIRDAHLQCTNNQYTKFNKRNENFWSYRLHRLGTQKVLWTGGWVDGVD